MDSKSSRRSAHCDPVDGCRHERHLADPGIARAAARAKAPLGKIPFGAARAQPRRDNGSSRRGTAAVLAEANRDEPCA